MKTSVLTALLFILSSLVWGLSSNILTSAFTLDTVEPTLDLLTPNGGEEWYLGDSHDIVWTATDTNLNSNSVALWYSLNGGTDYLAIATGAANTLSYPWQLPDTQSYNARVRIRISDAYGNFAQDASAAPFSLTYVPPAAPTGLNVDISNNVDAVITWQPVTHTIMPYNTPITPDGYIVLYNESPFDGDQYYYYLCDVISGTSYTHLRVALRRQQMYYRVVAYKDYQSRMANLLETLNQPGAAKLNWGAMKRIINADGNTDLQSVMWGDLQSPPQNPARKIYSTTYPTNKQSLLQMKINGDKGDKRDTGDNFSVEQDAIPAKTSLTRQDKSRSTYIQQHRHAALHSKSISTPPQNPINASLQTGGVK